MHRIHMEIRHMTRPSHRPPTVWTLLVVLSATLAVTGCAAPRAPAGDGGTPKFVADTLTAKGVRP